MISCHELECVVCSSCRERRSKHARYQKTRYFVGSLHITVRMQLPEHHCQYIRITHTAVFVSCIDRFIGRVCEKTGIFSSPDKCFMSICFHIVVSGEN